MINKFKMILYIFYLLSNADLSRSRTKLTRKTNIYQAGWKRKKARVFFDGMGGLWNDSRFKSTLRISDVDIQVFTPDDSDSHDSSGPTEIYGINNMQVLNMIGDSNWNIKIYMFS